MALILSISRPTRIDMHAVRKKRRMPLGDVTFSVTDATDVADVLDVAGKGERGHENRKERGAGTKIEA